MADYKIKCVSTDDDFFTVGNIYSVKNNSLIDDKGFNFTAWALNSSNAKPKINMINDWFASQSVFELVEDKLPTIVITSDGVSATATLREGKKVIRTAKATCCQNDTFDQYTGANIALGRLFGKEAKTEPKHEYHVGDYVEITGNSNFHRFQIGEVVKLAKYLYENCWKSETFCIRECDFKPHDKANKPQTPKQYTVKQDTYQIGDKVKIVDKWVDGCSQNSNDEMDKWLGKIMTIREIEVNDYRMKEDISEYGGWFWCSPAIEGKVVEINPVKEVKRPARVGEYIKIVDAYGTGGCYDNGDILKVSEVNDITSGVHVKTKKTHPCCARSGNLEQSYISRCEYVVLENCTEATK